jgi:hypothetical protein
VNGHGASRERHSRETGPAVTADFSALHRVSIGTPAMSDQPPSPPNPGPPSMRAGHVPSAKGPVLLASSRGAISVQFEGIEFTLAPEPAAAVLPDWAGLLSAGAEPGRAIRMHVALEHLRGTHDATVLRVFLRVAEPQAGHEAAETFLASAGLYGLRRASAPGDGEGLHCQLDVTAHAALLMRAMRGRDGRLMLAIRPHRPMPQGAAISIERIGLWGEQFG